MLGSEARELMSSPVWLEWSRMRQERRGPGDKKGPGHERPQGLAKGPDLILRAVRMETLQVWPEEPETSIAFRKDGPGCSPGNRSRTSQHGAGGPFPSLLSNLSKRQWWRLPGQRGDPESGSDGPQGKSPRSFQPQGLGREIGQTEDVPFGPEGLEEKTGSEGL